MKQISPHFTWKEVSWSPTAARMGIDNSVPANLQPNAVRMAETMEQVRALLGVPIKVSSWYRRPALNALIGGSARSAHMQALAVDFDPLGGMRLAEAFDRIAASEIAFDQLIHEATKDGADWIHLGLRTGPMRREILRARGAKLGGPMTYTRLAAA